MAMTRTMVPLAAAAMLLLTLSALSSAAPAFTTTPAAGRLEELVGREGIYAHLSEFQRIADLPQNRGSRAVFLGYNQSAEYVLARLAETDLAVSIQTLPAAVSEYVVDPVLALVKPFETSFKLNADFLGYNLAGSGSIEAQVQFVRGGCTSQDFARFTPGRIALLNRGAFTPAASNTTACPYRNLIDNAIVARAAAVLVFNPDDFLPMLGGTNDAPVPVFGVSSAVANFLNELILDGSEVVVRLQAESKKSTYTTYNILAETKTGKDDQVIVIGSHLDSVPAGAGINDNGSGSATILETALQFGKIPAPVNKVRFAWWAGEEWGLYGSNYYVDNLPRRELNKIALNLNFDMIGSPNYIRGIFNGRTATEDIRAGSTAIQELFEQHFDSKGLQYEPTPFNGRSDYGPFIENGIPAGGLFTGAEEKKTVEQRARYGGSANVAMDSCYHLSCDNVGNISPTAIEEMSAAAVSVLETLAFKEDLEGFLGGRSPRGDTTPKAARPKAARDTC